MTTINPKLTAAITTIALLAPAAGAQASFRKPERHFGSTQAERCNTRHHARRPAFKLQRDGRTRQ